MPSLAELFHNYDCEFEHLFTWYPIQESKLLPFPVIRGGRIMHTSGEFGPGLGGGSAQIHWLANLGPNDSVGAMGEIGVDENRSLYASLEVRIGSAVRRQRFNLPPSTRLPF